MVLPVRNQQQTEDIRLSTSTLVGGLFFFFFNPTYNDDPN